MQTHRSMTGSCLHSVHRHTETYTEADTCRHIDPRQVAVCILYTHRHTHTQRQTHRSMTGSCLHSVHTHTQTHTQRQTRARQVAAYILYSHTHTNICDSTHARTHTHTDAQTRADKSIHDSLDRMCMRCNLITLPGVTH